MKRRRKQGASLCSLWFNPLRFFTHQAVSEEPGASPAASASGLSQFENRNRMMVRIALMPSFQVIFLPSS